MIPAKKNRKTQVAIDSYIYALRNRIERAVNRLKNARRVATRYDEAAASFLPSSYRNPPVVPSLC
jgi:transposase